MKHKADVASLRRQMMAFREKLKRTPCGRLTWESSDAWRSWLRQEGISASRARQIMAEKSSDRPFNEEHAKNCIDYLSRHGYLVTKS